MPSLLAKSIPNKDTFWVLGFGKNKCIRFKKYRILSELRAIVLDSSGGKTLINFKSKFNLIVF